MHSQSLTLSQQHPQALLWEMVAFQEMELLQRVGSQQPPRALNHCTKVLYRHGSLKPAALQASQPDLRHPHQQAKLTRCCAPSLYLKALVYFIRDKQPPNFSLLVHLKVCSPPPYLQSFLIQHSVFALNLVSWPFLFSWVFCTSKN